MKKELNQEYTLLFNGITDAIQELDRLKTRLEKLQAQAESLFIEQEDCREEPVLFLGERRKDLEVS